jgi:hypothetical protein
MEHPQHPDRQFEQKEYRGARRILRWLGGLHRWSGPASDESNAMSSPNGHGNGKSGKPTNGTKAERQSESRTEEFLALLPDEVAEEIEKEKTRPKRIYPDAQDIGLSPAYPDPVQGTRDWRLLAPQDSDIYKDAVSNPITKTDDDYRSALKTLLQSIPRLD